MPYLASRRTRAAVAGPFLLLAACTSCTSALHGVSGRRAHVERLYFGRNRGSVEVVTDSAWTAFLRDVVTPEFPQGLTVWEASGQWQGAGGTLGRERSFVLEIVHPLDESGETRIERVIAAYKQRFGQESVLRVVTVGKANL
jgi:hypothetical protein